jgi:aldehyde dehydrogenase
MSSTLQLDEKALRAVVEDVLRNLGRLPGGSAPAPSAPAAAPAVRRSGPRFGVFDEMKDACAAAQDAFEQLKQKGFAGRAKVVEIVKAMATAKAEEWGKFEFDETKIGRLEHKVAKLQIVQLVPGVEWLNPYGLSGDHGVAAGNSVVFNPHPGGARSAAMAVRAYNEAIYAALGIENLVCTVEKPSLETFDALTKNEFVRLLCVTGGPAVVNAAMKSGKRAICAGPGNPPVLVDGTGSLQKAAADVVSGGGFDNNLLCIGEKQVFVLEQHVARFMEALKGAGAVQLNAQQVEKLAAEAFTFTKDAGGCSHPAVNRKYVGADAAVLAKVAGANAPAATPILFAQTDVENLFVMEEQMMPMIPVVAVKSIEQGIEFAKKSEHGYKHSAIIHSLNLDHMTMMARALDTTLFVKNGPSTAGLGLGGEGYLSYSIATTTGEGITNPKTFTRTRRSVTVDGLKLS